jgi:hypothetical protein
MSKSRFQRYPKYAPNPTKNTDAESRIGGAEMIRTAARAMDGVFGGQLPLVASYDENRTSDFTFGDI